MFQKEVADRILAKPKTKQYGRLTILANYRLDIVKSFIISKNSFFPIPSVDSKVIVFKPKLNIRYKINNSEIKFDFFDFTQALNNNLFWTT